MMFYKQINKFSIGLLSLIMALFMFVNTKLFFPEHAQAMHTQILTYLIFMAFAFSFPDLRSKLFNTSIFEGMGKLTLFAGLTYVFMSTIGGLFITPQYYQNIINVNFSILLMQSFVVAVAEESFFREFLGKKFGAILSSVIFAIFHYVAYDGDLIKTFVAFIMGLIFYYIHKKYGLESAIGSHAGFNLFIYASTKLIGG